MSYRNSSVNKERKNIRTLDKTTFIFIYLFLFIVIFSVSTIYSINIKNNIYDLKIYEIPKSQKRLDKLQNSIAVENKNNSDLKRNFAIKKAKELGMIKSNYSNIIDAWWNKEKINGQ